ncbi:MAG: hypothetical protein QRY72_02765 [Candidatus Rhabdochlamydia sp.]
MILSKLRSWHQHDTAYFEEALLQANGRKGKVLMDGIADNRKCYELAKRYNKERLTPPQKRAVIRHEPIYEKRNKAVRIIKGLGGDLEARSIWGKLTGYSQRSVVESMMSRWKRAFGGSLKSRCLDRR